MAHAEAHSHHDPVAARKEYFWVFKWLCALTALEVAVVYLKHFHVPATIIALLVVGFSSSKAVFVGYYYMHLKSETKWLKMIACLPAIAFAYAFFLALDLKVYQRPLEDYPGAPARTYEGHHHNTGDLPVGAALEQVVEAMPEGANKPRSTLGLTELPNEAVSERKSEGATPPATTNDATPEAPKAEGGGEWN